MQKKRKRYIPIIIMEEVDMISHVKNQRYDFTCKELKRQKMNFEELLRVYQSLSTQINTLNISFSHTN